MLIVPPRRRLRRGSGRAGRGRDHRRAMATSA